MAKSTIKTVLVIMLMTIVSQREGYAQRNTVGTSWSLSGIGITYERNTSEDTFAQVAIQADLGETFFGRAACPGVRGSFTWNIVFAQVETTNKNPVRFFAGPGLAAGICKDLNGPDGVIFGLKGKVGLDCQFARSVNLSVSLVPTLGLHVSKADGNVIICAYKYGLLQTILPEIGISYRFGR